MSPPFPSPAPSSNGHGPFDISSQSLVKIAIAIGIVVLATKIFMIGLMIFLGLLLAVSLDPLARKFQKFGMNRGFAITTIALLMSGLIVLVGFALIPSIVAQITSLIRAFPDLKNNLMDHIPGDNALKDTVSQILDNPNFLDLSTMLNQAAHVMKGAVEGLTEVSLILIFSIYLLVDGKRAFKWISDFFSAPTRLKLQATAKETSSVVYSYVMAQVITSIASGAYSFVVLHALKIPGALTLAVLAGLLDILPILGFFLAVIPAMLLALTVSPTSAILVFGFYILYHAIENYVIVPMVYSKSMKVSSLVVLIALLVAGSVGEILAAIAVLPVVASYPIIERIWLIKYLGRQVVSKHAKGDQESLLPDQVNLWNVNPLQIKRPSSGLSGHGMLKAFGKKILIVEDDPDIRSMLREILETEGYVAMEASNGKEGLEVLRRNLDIGLILLDMIMPIMNGRTFLDFIKTQEQFKKIPVIFLSGTADASNSAGADGVLRKPSEIDVVLDIVDKFYHHM